MPSFCSSSCLHQSSAAAKRSLFKLARICSYCEAPSAVRALRRLLCGARRSVAHTQQDAAKGSAANSYEVPALGHDFAQLVSLYIHRDSPRSTHKNTPLRSLHRCVTWNESSLALSLARCKTMRWELNTTQHSATQRNSLLCSLFP